MEFHYVNELQFNNELVESLKIVTCDTYNLNDVYLLDRGDTNMETSQLYGYAFT